QYNFLAGLDGIDVQLHLGLAIFERIFRALGLVRQQAFLSQRDKTNPELVGDRRAKEKSARIDPDDFVDRLSAALLEKRIDRRAEQRATGENGRDVLEDDSRFRKIRHL